MRFFFNTGSPDKINAVCSMLLSTTSDGSTPAKDSKMALCMLNYDILPNIFGHLTAMDYEAPYILMLVCTAWQEVVLRTPVAWSHILIDDRLPDIEARCETSLILSRNKPLVVTVCLPVKSIDLIKKASTRISLIKLNIYQSTSQDDTVMRVLDLLDELGGPERYRGAVQWQQDGRDIFLTPEFIYAGLDIENYDEYLNDNLDNYWPILLTNFSIKRPMRVWDDSSIPLSAIGKLLLNLDSLQCLELDDEFIKDAIGYTPTILPLQNLKRLYVHAEDRRGQGQALIQLISTIQASSIEEVHFKSSPRIIALAIRILSPTFCPTVLTICITSAVQPYRLPSQYTAPLSRLRRLVIEPRNERGWQSLTSHIHDLMSRLPHLLNCHFILNRSISLIEPTLSLVTCSIHITFQGRGCPDLSYFRSWSTSRIPIIDTLELHINDYIFINSGKEAKEKRSNFMGAAGWKKPRNVNENYAIDGYGPPAHQRLLFLHMKKLRIRPSNGWSGMIVNPEDWPPDIEELEAEGCYFSREFISSAEYGVDFGPFHALTTIITPTESAAYLLKGNLVPCVRDITLSISFGLHDEDALFDTLEQGLTIHCGRNGQTIRSLGFKYYPPWLKLVQFLHRNCSSKEEYRGAIQSEFILKLPGLPHLGILRGLVDTLRGKVTGALTVPVIRLSYKEYWSLSLSDATGCYFCQASGWNCTSRPNHRRKLAHSCQNAGLLFCERHSENELVSVTQYTI